MPAPGEETWPMVVMNARGSCTGFRDIAIRYRSGPIHPLVAPGAGRVSLRRCRGARLR
jgi:hypothetical protein